jgi:hypothetical protein
MTNRNRIMTISRLAPRLLATALLGWGLASTAGATDEDPCAGTPPPVAAKYRVTLSVRGAAPQRGQEWLFVRNPRQVAVLKGDVEEVWRCDGPLGVRLERIFHADQHVAEYAAGELRALNVVPSWVALATMFDEKDLSNLKPAGTVRRGSTTLTRYRGTLGAERIELEWDAATRLPARLVRTTGKASVRYERLESHATVPAHWPVPAARSADYARIDAADFGDMEYNAFVRKAEARDVRAGWRSAHEH